MDFTRPLSVRFRHVVFPREATRRRKVVNVAVAGGDAPPGEQLDLLPEENASFFHWLFAQAGLDARLYRAETLQRRLPACLRALRARTPAQARRALEEKPALLATAINAMLVGVTSFFRDPGVFDLLRDQLLPALAQGRSGLHVWSAGCSEGAELYSVALLLAERGLLANSYLLGTDCRHDAITAAKAGAFDTASMKNVPPALLARYFTREGLRWQVATAIRLALRWRTADLLQTIEPGFWDVILCRNTTMYLRADAVLGIWHRLETALRPGGILVLGKAERPQEAKRLSPVGPCVYQRTRG